MKHVRTIFALAASAVLVGSALALAVQPPAEPGQHPRTFEKQIVVKLNYLLFLPEDYTKEQDKKWPLMLFLHGAGERGSDINKVKVHGPPKIVEGKKDFPFIVVSPQCPDGSWWDPQQLISLLDEIQANYRVDTDRIYVTGLSMGGFGTWDLAQRYADRFAAIAPICGAGNPAAVRRMGKLPAWIFHGDKDPTVAVENSDQMYEAMKKAGIEVKYTRYEGVGHDSWTATYNNPELYTWLLAHKRSDRPARADGRR